MKRKLPASSEGAVKAMKSQHESYTSPRRLSGYSGHLNPDTTSESTEDTTGNPSNGSTTQCDGNETVTESTNVNIDNTSSMYFLQSRGSETITESVNASIAINNVPMQLIEHKSSGVSFGATFGNYNIDVYPVTVIEDDTALFEESHETVQDTVDKYYV